jgi:hypothetical protein
MRITLGQMFRLSRQCVLCGASVDDADPRVSYCAQHQHPRRCLTCFATVRGANRYCDTHLVVTITCLNCTTVVEVPNKKVFYCPLCAHLPRCSRCKRRGHHLPTCHWSSPNRRPVPTFRGVLTPADFEQFYAERYRHAVAYASKFLGLVDAEDVVQDVFVYIFTRLDTLPDLRPTRLFAWVKFAAIHEKESAWRRRIIPCGALDDIEAHSVRSGRDREIVTAV